MSAQSRVLTLPQSGGATIGVQAAAVGKSLADFVARRPASVIGACALILIMLVWSSTLAQVKIDRQETQETLRRSDATLTRAVAEHTVRTLKGADQALLLLKRHYEKSDGRLAIGDYARSLVVGRVFSQLAACRTWESSVSKSTAAVHFSPPSCPIAGLWGGECGKNCPRWGRFSLSTPQVRQAAS